MRHPSVINGLARTLAAFQCIGAVEPARGPYRGMVGPTCAWVRLGRAGWAIAGAKGKRGGPRPLGFGSASLRRLGLVPAPAPALFQVPPPLHNKNKELGSRDPSCFFTMIVQFSRAGITLVVKMTAEAFDKWLQTMGISASEAARRLGVHRNTVTRFRRKGAPMVVALACAALFHRLEAWGKGYRYTPPENG